MEKLNIEQFLRIMIQVKSDRELYDVIYSVEEQVDE